MSRGRKGGKWEKELEGSDLDCRDTACKVALQGLCGALETQTPVEMMDQLGHEEAQKNGNR